MKIAALVLIGIGLIGLGWGGLTWTRSEKVIDIGPIEVSKEKKSTFPIPPVIGVVGIATGLVLLAKNKD